MTFQPHYLSNFDEDSGLQTYYEPFLLPEKAFPVLENAYVWRGKVKKREGFTFLGRLRRDLTLLPLNQQATGASCTIADVLNDPAIDLRAPISGVPETYAEIQPTTVSVQLHQGIGPITTLTDPAGDGILTDGGTNTGIIYYSSGKIVLNFVPALVGLYDIKVDFFYYPALPCMGLKRQETDIINEGNLIAFDRKYAYTYSAPDFQELNAITPTTWGGNDYEFFWTTNYYRDTSGRKLFWATNFSRIAPDPIYYYDTTDWIVFNPITAADNAATPSRLVQARILLAYKNRLIAMNTYESDTTGSVKRYPNRIRFSQNGTPLTIGVVGAGPVWTTVGAWASDLPGYGGWIDLPTSEQIVTAEFIKDVLLVKCERSSYKLIYTGIPSVPFIFEKINTDFGAESTFSQVAFDNAILTIGNTAITQDDSINVIRIDQKIPDLVFDIENKNHGTERVHGVRDFAKELVLWTYPNTGDPEDNTTIFPNKMLIYNYRNNSYAIFDDYFTCLGYFQRPSDLTWATIPYQTWSDWQDYWDSGAAEAWYPSVVGGNQQGYVEVLFGESNNDISLSITAMSGTSITVPNHNLPSGSFVLLSGILSTGLPDLTVFNGIIYKVLSIDYNTIKLLSSDGITLVNVGAGTNYIGNGHLTVKNNLTITTKIFAPFYEQASQLRLGYVDFLIDKTTKGEVTADILINECSSLSETDPTTTIGNLGSNILLTRPEDTTLIPYQPLQKKIWHRKYVESVCQNFQIVLSMTDAQMFDKNITDSDFVLHAMIFHLSKNARLIQ